MAETQKILETAKELGDMLARHDAVRRLQDVLDRFEKDTESQRALTDLNRHIETVAEKQASGKPIEVQDKHKLESLQKTVAKNQVLRELQVAQMDFQDLLRQVDEAMMSRLDVPTEQSGAASAGAATPPPGAGGLGA